MKYLVWCGSWHLTFFSDRSVLIPRSDDILLAILDDQLDGDIAPRGIRVGTDLVGQLYQRLRLGTLDAWDLNVHLNGESHLPASDRADSNSVGDDDLTDVLLLPPGRSHERTFEAGGKAGREELLGIRPWAACSTHLMGNVQVDVQVPVRGASVTVSPTDAS